jgi:hypothetical protein
MAALLAAVSVVNDGVEAQGEPTPAVPAADVACDPG